jgi:hypothetical protein
VLEGRSFTFTVHAEGALPLYYQWRKGGVDIPGATNSSYVINPVLPMHTGLYSVSVTNSWGTVESSSATLTVIPREPPLFLFAVAHANLTNITLSFSEPLDVQSAESPSHYQIQGFAGALDVLSATLVGGTNVVLVNNPRASWDRYSITLDGVTDNSVARHAPIPNTRVVFMETVVLAPDDFTVWRFNQSSNDLGSAWRMVGYDDTQAGWETGLAGLSSADETAPPGFELRTLTLTPMTSGGPNTTYFRTHFSFPFATNGARLQAVGVIDDGAVFYINGVEAGRVRLTNDPVLFGDLSAGAGPENTNFHSAEGPFALSTQSLLPGENLLAVELHQNSPTSSDAVLSIQLVAIVDPIHVDCFPTLRIRQDSANGQVTIAHECQGKLQETTELLAIGTLWSDVPGNPNPYLFTPAPNSKRFFRLVP